MNELQDKLQEAKQRANACSDDVVARRHMCGGCHGDTWCNLSQKWFDAHGLTVLDKIIGIPESYYDPDRGIDEADELRDIELEEIEAEASVNDILDFERLQAVGFEPDEITAALQDPTRRRLV